MKRASRRDFLKLAAAASLATGLPVAAQSQQSSDTGNGNPTTQAARAMQSSGPAVGFPRLHSGRQLARISFPLGGIGTGGIGLGGRGNLQDWEIFNRPDRGNSPQYAFPSMWVKTADAAPYSVVPERRILPPYDLQPEGLGFNVPGLPRLAEAKFSGSFPLARIQFEDADCPVNISLEAFSPFQPLDTDASGLPCAILSYEVRAPETTAAEVAIAWSVENPAGQGKMRRNSRREAAGLQGLLMDDPSLAADDPMRGSFALAALSGDSSTAQVLRAWPKGSGWRMGPQHFWFDSFAKTGQFGEESEISLPVGSVSLRQTVPAGQQRIFRFLLAWQFPNRTAERCGWEAPKGDEKTLLGNYYCTRFADAWAVAEYVTAKLQNLEAGTRGFVDALRKSTLPNVVKEAASANLSTLVANTSFRIADGSFHGFEGCGDNKGLGFGTCTHVWNYEVATQFVFPALARSMRETSFGYATDADGHMDFRHKLPLGKEHWGAAAADGQMGQIVKLYFDWKLCGDDAWMRAQWPAAKRALAYAWRPGGWDSNKDGVMEGVQHNTYDVEFYGPNPMCGSWYLAALKASALMAAAAGDDAFAAECAKLAAQGGQWIDANLFNGEYFIQQIRGVPKEEVAPGLIVGMGAKDTLKPDYQVGAGCLIDQLVGQYMATVAGLGPLLDEDHIRKTLESIYRYNYKRDLGRHASVQRVYALNDEAALIVCEFPRGGRPETPMPYYSENFTGLEYLAAVLMMANGMVNEGVECFENVRRRYDGERANPFDETEYGRHYARPMSSWAAIPVLTGFEYDGREHRLEVAPKWNANPFRAFWSTPAAWGSFELNKQGFLLKPAAGAIQLRELKLPWPDASKLRAISGEREIAQIGRREGKGTILLFAKPVTVSADSPLHVELGLG